MPNVLFTCVSNVGQKLQWPAVLGSYLTFQNIKLHIYVKYALQYDISRDIIETILRHSFFCFMGFVDNKGGKKADTADLIL